MKHSILGAARARFIAAGAVAPALIGLLAPLSSVDAVPLAKSYELTTIGFTDVEHTRNDGYRATSAQFINVAGQAAGYAERFNGTATNLGQSAWLYNGSSTLNVGLTDTEHTRIDGYRHSDVRFLNAAGQVAGYADRYNTTGALRGTTAWLYNGNSTVSINLTDTLHTSIDGRRYSDVTALNDSGHAAGFSNRFGAYGEDLGRSAWLYNGSNTVNIGPADTEHTTNYGYSFSTAHFLNAAGQVAGTAHRFNAESFGPASGQSAWLFNRSSTVNIGITDTEHTADDGSRYSDVMALTAAGHVVGSAIRYNGTGTYRGKSAWLYNGNSTVNIGLTDAEHTAGDYRSSDPKLVNAAGQVAGVAQRSNGGNSAWVFNGNSTVNVGLTDAEHTRNDGYRDSDVKVLNAAGQAAGDARRYSGVGADLGRSVWLYNGSTTVNIGLTGPEHNRNDGYRYSAVQFLNTAGQAAGFSTRYNGTGIWMGQSAWFYDGERNQTFALDLALRSDGYGFSSIYYLGDDGLSLGYYSLFDSNDTLLGHRAFAFTLEDGAVDLGGLIEGGFASLDWAALAIAFRGNDRGQIFGQGLLADMPSGRMSYVLTPVSAVPLPAAAWLFGTGLLALIGLARRKEP